MTTTQLKWIAIITMLIDHTGAVLFPGTILLRIIGRLAFPIFAFLLTIGYEHTRNVYTYGIRLGIFALLSEIPFDMAFNDSIIESSHQNIFFTLFLGLIGIKVFDILYHRFNQYVGMAGGFLVGLVAEFLHTDYGIIGVVLIVGIYTGRSLSAKGIYIGLVNIIYGFSQVLSGYLPLQMFGGLSGAIIQAYNNKKGVGLKYFFYIFYPGHLLILHYLDSAFNSVL